MPLVTNGATLRCSFGLVPSQLRAFSAPPAPAATITDHQSMANILPFGQCTCPSNPDVAAAMAANHGTLTPQPCVPVTLGPWVPGSPTDLVNGVPALTMTSVCHCAYGGTITILTPGQ